MAGYIGVNNESKKIKNLYIGINGTSRKVLKAYIGDSNQQARLWFNNAIIKPSFDGLYDFKGDPAGDWELILLSSGELTVDYNSPVDVFLVGGGASGIEGYRFSQRFFGGGGGQGGECVEQTLNTFSDTFTVQIGESDQDTFMTSINNNLTARAGRKAEILPNATEQAVAGGGKAPDGGELPDGHNGGKGGDGVETGTGGTGDNGHLAFNDPNTLYNPGYLYGAGGGGGSGLIVTPQEIPIAWGHPGAGGLSGGGHGGSHTNDPEYYHEATNGLINSGGGGGGYCVYSTSDPNHFGGSGIIIIRNHRTI